MISSSRLDSRYIEIDEALFLSKMTLTFTNAASRNPVPYAPMISTSWPRYILHPFSSLSFQTFQTLGLSRLFHCTHPSCPILDKKLLRWCQCRRGVQGPQHHNDDFRPGCYEKRRAARHAEGPRDCPSVVCFGAVVGANVGGASCDAELL